MTVATDGAEMYESERERIGGRDFPDGFDEVAAGEGVRPLPARRGERPLHRDEPRGPTEDLQPRLLHLGRAARRVDRRLRRAARSAIWIALEKKLETWDEMIGAFNDAAGVEIA